MTVRKGTIYTLGVIPLGAAYYWLGALLPNHLAFFAVVVGYLVGLRVIAELVGNAE